MLLSSGALSPVQGGIAPVGLADSTPILANSNYFPNNLTPLSGNIYASYAGIYKSQLWVYTVVRKLAFATARLPLKVYERGAVGRPEARDTPFAQLLRNPNSRHDPFYLWLWTASTLEVYGEALWVKIRPRPGAAPVQVWPIHPTNVFTRREQDGTLTYVYSIGSATAPIIEIPERDVVHFKTYNPDNGIRGMSALEPLRATLQNEDAARRASSAFWRNGARPSVVLTHPGKLGDVAATRLKASWDNIHGGVDNMAKTAVLEEGMTPNVLSLSAEEAQYIQSRRLNREEVCGAYDVPPPVVHILDRATFSNITEQMRSMYRDTMAPRLSLIESALDVQLRPDFDPAGNLYAEFLLDEVLRGAFEQRAAAYETMTRIGGMTPGEVRNAENLPYLGPETDRLYVNAATIPLGEVTKRAQMVQEGAELLPLAADTAPVPTPKKAIAVCRCGMDGVLSVRGLCRSCEGKVGALLTPPRLEIPA